jgi:uncharacterized ferritin-like protein (DUF455 family)
MAIAGHLRDWAVKIMLTGDADEKARLTHNVAAAFGAGQLSIDVTSSLLDTAVPASPARPTTVTIADPRKVKGGKGLKSTFHALAHAESYAIDLSWDIIARFGWSPETWTSAAAAVDSLLSADGTRLASHEFAARRAGILGTDGSALREKRAARALPREFFEDWVRKLLYATQTTSAQGIKSRRSASPTRKHCTLNRGVTG